MIDASISVDRMRDLVRPGRFNGCDARFAALAAVAALCASCAESLGSRPRAAGSRSGVDELMAPII